MGGSVLDFGFNCRSKVQHEFDAKVKVKGDLLRNSVTGKVNAEIDVPTIVGFSMRYGLKTDLNLLASVQFHRWSDWGQTTVNFANASNMTINRQRDDVCHLALGSDYRLNDDWRIQVGISYKTFPR